MTQTEIARLLGVSQGTVSMALNHPESTKVSREIREKIVRFCKERKLMRSPSRHQTWNIGFLVNKLCFRDEPFYRPVLEGVESAAKKYGYSLMLELYRERQTVKMVKYQKVDGVILLAGWVSPHQAQSLAGKPVVLCNEANNRISCDSVIPDAQAIMLLPIRHLLELGHRRIAHFSLMPKKKHPFCEITQSSLRAQAFLHIAATFGTFEDLLFCREMETPGLPQTRRALEEELDEAMTREDPPTAIVATDQYLCILREILAERGLRVPEDISLAGIDNLDRFNQDSPFFTSVDMRFEYMGRTAVKLLHERIINPEKPHEKVLYEPELILRKSTAPPRGSPDLQITHKQNNHPEKKDNDHAERQE